MTKVHTMRLIAPLARGPALGVVVLATAAMPSVFSMRAIGAGSPQAPAPSQPAAAPPATDIYLLTISGGIASMKDAKPSPVSAAPGYDNQPMFSPDGGRILFAANRDGKQTDVFVFEREGTRVSQLTETAENENSPTWLPAGLGGPGGFSVVRTELDKTQRLWRFDARGRSPQLVLTDIKPVGYHAWITFETVALFVLGPPSTLQIANVPTGKAEIAAEGIGRSLHRIPGTRLVSFVHRDGSGEFWVKQIEIASKKIEPLVKVVEGNTERDMAWMPDGKTILMSGGTKIFSWTRGAPGWTEVFDAAPHGLGAVSRLAVSPKGDAVAIVVAEPKK
jgi:WD40-like Beta Propeller Repeat